MSKKGIDISVFQDGMSMTTVKNMGFEFAIIRGGYTGYGEARSKNVDRCFEGFYKQAKAIGLPVGCYYYSCANTREGGVAEAEFLYEQCLKGKAFEYPIYIDVEESRWQTGNKAGVTDAILGFCETLKAKGFYPGVYASLSWFQTYIDTKRLDGISKWVAAWRNTKPPFEWSKFDMWQNADDGYIVGQRVDTDVAYVDFPALMKAQGVNGYKKEAPAAPAAGTDQKEVICKVDMKQISKGSSGAQVKTAQALLVKKYGYSVGISGVDGIFGDKTDDAVRRFQKAKGLAVDGIIGVNTWNALLH